MISRAPYSQAKQQLHKRWRSRAKKEPSRSDKPSEATATHSTTPPERWRSRATREPASFFLREEIGRIVA